MLSSVDHEKSFITSGPGQETLPADLSHEILNQIAQKNVYTTSFVRVDVGSLSQHFLSHNESFFHWNPIHMFM